MDDGHPSRTAARCARDGRPASATGPAGPAPGGTSPVRRACGAHRASCPQAAAAGAAGPHDGSRTPAAGKKPGRHREEEAAMPVTTPTFVVKSVVKSVAKSARTAAQPITRHVTRHVARFIPRQIARITRITRITVWAVVSVIASVAASVIAWAAAARRGPVRGPEGPPERLPGVTAPRQVAHAPHVRDTRPEGSARNAGRPPRGPPTLDSPTENPRKILTGDGKKVPALWSRLGDDREQMGISPINSCTFLSGR